MGGREPAQQGQESVWDYPRPPRVEPVRERVTVMVDGRAIADSTAALRVLETSHPPVYYLPPGDIEPGVLRPNGRRSWCEYKGAARYLDVAGRTDAAWTYPQPSGGYSSLAGYVAFYPSRVDRASVGMEDVTAQDGDFYGGWITSRIVGPFKGGPGTWGW